MADMEHQNMSLVRYSTSDKDIVLRHNEALVLVDPRSKQLVLRQGHHSNAMDIASCPTCKRPFHDEPESYDQGHRGSHANVDANFISPEYFRLLHHQLQGSADPSAPPSPRKRLAQPVNFKQDSRVGAPADAEFIGSSPASPPSPQGISSAAFSPDYFKRIFVEEGELGRGGKGVVLLVKHVLDGVSLGQFACKRVPVGDDHQWLEKVLVEVQLLQNLSHKNLVSYKHVWLEDVTLTNFGPSVPCAFILQQYCNAGDLHRFVCSPAQSTTTMQQLKERIRRRSKGQSEPPRDLRGPKRLHFDQIYSFFKDITSGLNHLHVHGYIHRDLKPQNCLLNDNGKTIEVLVSDFGEMQSEDMVRKSTGATGTVSFCAPEVLRRDNPDGAFGNFTTKSDIFSLGMILYFMCFGRLPYTNADINEENEDLDLLRDEISTWSGFDEELRVRSDLPDKLYKFLKRLLSFDPAQRPTTEEILLGIKTGSGLDETNGSYFGGPNGTFEDIRSSSRISRVDSQTPEVPHGRASGRNITSSSALTRPNSSKLRSTSSTKDNSHSSSSISLDDDEGSAASTHGSSLVLRRDQPYFPSSPKRPQTPRIMPAPYPGTKYSFVRFEFLYTVTKIMLFFFKIISVIQPCSPFAANTWISCLLIGLAMLDMMLSPVEKLGGNWALLGMHCLVLLMASHWNFLCMADI
ncbi:MAG: putative serine/threonine-protein kinase iks1 [Candelina mexicana]|nr:MAG: putative serine/threonine-protein kinase iks1 [Candelina mexicana]